MQHLKLFSAILFSSFLLYSCTGNTNANKGKESDSVASPGTTASTSDASFSYKIDGKVYSWSENNPSFANKASMDSTNEVFFTLMSNDPAEKDPQQVGFGVAATGSTTIDNDNMDRFKSSGSNGGNHFVNFHRSYLTGQAGAHPNYEFGTASTVTVVITSKSETRIAGTFSGELINAATQKPALLTDGKFDLPFKPYSKK
jgi:hypothetical protein